MIVHSFIPYTQFSWLIRYRSEEPILLPLRPIRALTSNHVHTAKDRKTTIASPPFAKMPGRTLPTLTEAEVQKHNTAKSCYVTIGKKVYDVTDFLDSHPGGADLVLDYAGKDIADILKDEDSHAHSETAYEVLDDSLVGFLVTDKLAANGHTNGSANGNGVANGNGTANGNGNGVTQINGEVNQYVHPRTGMSCEEDLSRDTDLDADYKKHKFLDLNRPLLMQVWFGGFSKEFYLDQVHRPRHYRGGASAPLFGNFLEPLSLTPWWVVPLVWGPCVSYGTFLAAQGFLDRPIVGVAYWIGGFFLWSLIEYILHRFLFHLDE